MEQMLEKIDKAKQKLDEEKQRLKAKIKSKEEMLRIKEKKQLFNQLVEIGKVAQKANINDIDRLTLLGAFIEISKVKEDPSKLASWRKQGELLEEKNSQSDSSALTIKFSSTPSEANLKKIKELKFKWNRFRKEFYGYGNKETLNNLLKNDQPIIEEIK